jgi:DNA-binding NarL/FixJ family response regulator
VKTISILIADSQYLIREGLKSLFAQHNDIKFVAEVNTKEELFTQLKKLKPAIVILDYNQQENFTVNDIPHLKKISPSTHILIISEIANKELVHMVVEHGVMGFLTKTCDKSEIVEAIYALNRGERLYCHKVLNIILDHTLKNTDNCEPAILSQREIEIIRLIANGLTTKEIADTLFRSFHTISTHRKNIMKKIGINSTSELIVYAMNTGLIQAEMLESQPK